MLACDGGVSGTCAYAREKTADCLAKASRFGVNPRVDPRNPIRSARVVSRVIRMMLGDFEIEAEALAAGAASALASRIKTKQSQRPTAFMANPSPLPRYSHNAQVYNDTAVHVCTKKLGGSFEPPKQI